MSLLKSRGDSVIAEGQVAKSLRDAIDRLFDNVFSTVAFQTALVCTYAEAVQEALGDVEHSTTDLLDEYIGALNTLFGPRNIDDLKRLMHTFEGLLEVDGEVKLVQGGPTFRQVVLPGEMQPAEWPKYRYVLIELWNSNNDKIRTFIEEDRSRGRKQLAQALYQRRLRAYCEEHRIAEADLDRAVKDEILGKSKAMFEEFLGSLVGKRINLEKNFFQPAVPSASVAEINGTGSSDTV